MQSISKLTRVVGIEMDLLACLTLDKECQLVLGGYVMTCLLTGVAAGMRSAKYTDSLSRTSRWSFQENPRQKTVISEPNGSAQRLFCYPVSP